MRNLLVGSEMNYLPRATRSALSRFDTRLDDLKLLIIPPISLPGDRPSGWNLDDVDDEILPTVDSFLVKIVAPDSIDYIIVAILSASSEQLICSDF